MVRCSLLEGEYMGKNYEEYLLDAHDTLEQAEWAVVVAYNGESVRGHLIFPGERVDRQMVMYRVLAALNRFLEAE